MAPKKAGKAKKSDTAGKPDPAKALDIVKEGSTVMVEYTGTFDDGTVFDSSQHGDHSHPLQVKMGAGQVIPGFEKALIGMKKGEEKSVKLKPSEAYGEPRYEMMRQVPRSSLPMDKEPEPGMVLLVGLPDGQQFPVRISSVDKDTVTLDLNHPLAGKNLNFKLKIVEISF